MIVLKQMLSHSFLVIRRLLAFMYTLVLSLLVATLFFALGSKGLPGLLSHLASYSHSDTLQGALLMALFVFTSSVFFLELASLLTVQRVWYNSKSMFGLTAISISKQHPMTWTLAFARTFFKWLVIFLILSINNDQVLSITLLSILGFTIVVTKGQFFYDLMFKMRVINHGRKPVMAQEVGALTPQP